MTSKEKQLILEKMRDDIVFFSQTLFPETCTQDTPAFHGEVYRTLQDDDKKQVSVIMARGHGKSTVASKIYPLHRILFRTLKYIVIISESEGQSIDLIREIKDEIEFNQRLQFFFGDITGSRKWTETDIITKTNIRIFGRGSRQRIRGTKYQSQRPELVLIDDFESELNTETEEQRLKLKKWVNGSVLPAIDPHRGKIFLIGTIVHEDSYLNDIRSDHLLDEPLMGWELLFYAAIKEDGESLWPERFPLAKLNQIRRQYAAQNMEYMFYQEYMNEPIPPDAGLVKRAWIKENQHETMYIDGYWWINKGIDRNDNWVNAYAFLGIDPSLGKKGGDFSGIISILRDCDDEIHIKVADGVRINPFELVESIFDMVDTEKFMIMGLETVMFQEVLKGVIDQEMIKRKIYFGLEEFNPREKKGLRLQSLVPYYAQKQVNHLSFFEELKNELLLYPKAKHDDLLDALVYAINVSYRPSKKRFPGKKGKLKKANDDFIKEFNWMCV